MGKLLNLLNIKSASNRRSVKVEDEEKFVPSNSFRDFLKGMVLVLKERYILYSMCAFIPFAIASHFAFGDIATFVLCMLSIIPLSKLLGTATEELSLRTGETVGGLLNATFGNAVELIISIVALKDGLLRIVQASLLGSILSNLLLVMGMSFLLGGYYYKEQHFNLTASQTSSSLLLMALMGILMPAVFFLSESTDADGHKILALSRFVSFVMLFIYVSYLFFQLRTHKFLYENQGDDKSEKSDDDDKSEKPNQVTKHKEEVEEIEEERVQDLKIIQKAHEEEEEEEETPRLSVWGAIVLLLAVTVLVAVLSEFLVGSIESVTEKIGISDTFIGIIILPIVGNAAEHVTAVTVAMKNKMDLSIGVAIGSSIQIALLVIPLLVILGWIIGQPLTLYFYMFETVSLFLAVIVTNAVIADGSSNWLEGTFLICAYIIIAAGFYYHD